MTKNRNTRPQANSVNSTSTQTEVEVTDEVSIEHPETVEALREVAREVLGGLALLSGLLSGPRAVGEDSVVRVEIKQILLRGEHRFQFAYHRNRQVTHRNLPPAEAQTEFVALLSRQFRQALLHTAEGRVQITLNRRYDVRIRKTAEDGATAVGAPSVPNSDNQPQNTQKTPKKSQYPIPANTPNTTATSNQQPATSNLFLPHDRQKNHLLPEGTPVPFLIGLGVMTAEGRVVAAKRDKFRQINRFLEMVADVVAPLEMHQKQTPERPLRIVDFGCGKAYLTFALYHYLHVQRGLNIALVGVDRKQDVLAECTALAQKLQFTGLSFVVGDIVTSQEAITAHFDQFDMVVALHACDTATDDALVAGVVWGAQVILVAPCCQHELFAQIGNVAETALLPMVRHGIVRERMTGLITDTLRAEWLAANGYAVQMLEFVEAEHTPKNLMLRATKRATGAEDPHKRAAEESYAHFRDFWNLKPYLEEAFLRAVAKEIL